MDYSKSLKTECRRSALGSVQEKIMADLMAIGWRDVNAYVAAYGYNAQYSDDYNKQQIEKITSRPEFQKYLEKTRKRYEILTRRVMTILTPTACQRNRP